MGFASSWLEKSALFPQFVPEEPDNNTGIITVVPAYNEPDITVLLDSLNNCQPTLCKTEVLVVINSPPSAPKEFVLNNKETLKTIRNWKEKNNPFFRLYCFETPPLDGWGVGMARKSGMDEALRRFNKIGNPAGVILSTDADCTVENNYFRAVETELLNRKHRSACSLYFEHNTPDPDLRKKITDYELHLRYYVAGLKYAGYPYPFHTVGSSMAVKAVTYLKTGGMNRKQAGEDFYFIQKLVGAGGYFSLVSTTVYPSSRKSYRVPFGTGATMEKLSKGEGIQFQTYNIKAFIQLKTFFDMLDKIYKSVSHGITDLYSDLPAGVRSFISAKEFEDKITEIRDNTSGYKSFRKRFFDWFNMFKIIRFMNHIHAGVLEKRPVMESATDLLGLTGARNKFSDPEKLLAYYRNAEKLIISP